VGLGKKVVDYQTFSTESYLNLLVIYVFKTKAFHKKI
jgi:hypothetical protein